MQNFWLGLIAAGIVGVQLVIIPQMRRRLIRLGRERQLTARELSGRVGEIVDGIGTIHIHDTSNYERADIAARLGRIFKIRYDLYQWKFLVKFINNFLAQVTPFLFYLIGGYLALQGRLDIGQLVAVIAAYKDLPGPLKELIDWDQNAPGRAGEIRAGGRAVHASTRMIDPKHPDARRPSTSAPLERPARARSTCRWSTTAARRLLERVSLQIQPGETVAMVGTAASGAEALAEAFARLIWPESGKHHASASTTCSRCRNRSPAGASPTLRRTPICSRARSRDNLLYGLKHAPLTEPTYDGAAAPAAQVGDRRGAKAGNPDFDVNSDWIDYAAAGATGPDDLFTPIRPVLDAVDPVAGHHRPGAALARRPGAHPELVERIVELRHALRERLEEEGLSEPGRAVRARRLQHARRRSARTCCFGTATGPALADKALAANPYFTSVLKEAGLDRDALRHGPGDRRQRDRAVRRPAAGQPVLPAAHLHDAGRNPGLPAAAAEAAGASRSTTASERGPGARSSR